MLLAGTSREARGDEEEAEDDVGPADPVGGTLLLVSSKAEVPAVDVVSGEGMLTKNGQELFFFSCSSVSASFLDRLTRSTSASSSSSRPLVFPLSTSSSSLPLATAPSPPAPPRSPPPLAPLLPPTGTPGVLPFRRLVRVTCLSPVCSAPCWLSWCRPELLVPVLLPLSGVCTP